MIYYKNGARWENNWKYEDKKNMPYDYERNGLLVRLLPDEYVKSENKVFQAVLRLIEKPCVSILRLIDVLNNYRNVNWRNY